MRSKLTNCGRCKVEVHTDDAEVCWWCHADLCSGCWDEHGHCGHPEAEPGRGR